VESDFFFLKSFQKEDTKSHHFLFSFLKIH